MWGSWAQVEWRAVMWIFFFGTARFGSTPNNRYVRLRQLVLPYWSLSWIWVEGVLRRGRTDSAADCGRAVDITFLIPLGF